MNSSREERIAEYRRGQPLDILRKRAEMARTRSRLWTQEDIDVIAVEGRKLFRDVVGCEGRMTGLLGGGIPFSVYESKITGVRHDSGICEPI